jgi:hypothetical protein
MRRHSIVLDWKVSAPASHSAAKAIMAVMAFRKRLRHGNSPRLADKAWGHAPRLPCRCQVPKLSGITRLGAIYPAANQQSFRFAWEFAGNGRNGTAFAILPITRALRYFIGVFPICGRVGKSSGRKKVETTVTVLRMYCHVRGALIHLPIYA